MSTIIILVIGMVILVGLFFGFKYFTKTTTVIVVLITGGLVRDYQYTRLPEKYDQLKGIEGFFDQQRNIVPENQDQYPKMVKVINEYNNIISSFDQFQDLRNEYATILNKTGSSLGGFINENMSEIISFEEETLQNTPISKLDSILSGGIWGDADPAKNIEAQTQGDVPKGSQLIKDLTMIGSVYCYKYGLEQTSNKAGVYKNKCIKYFSHASKITKHLHDRKGTLILGLVSLVNTNNILQSLQLLGNGSYTQDLKPIIKENFSFLGDQDIKKIVQEYIINDYNAGYVSIIKEAGEKMITNGVKEGLGWSFNPYKGNYFIDNTRIIDGVKEKSINWGKYFYSFYRSGSVLDIERPVLMGEYIDRGEYGGNICMKGGVEIPCDETSSSYYLDKEINVLSTDIGSRDLNHIIGEITEREGNYRYGSSISRHLLSILGLDKGKYLINIISAQNIISFVPRLTGYEKQVLKARDLYLELIK